LARIFGHQVRKATRKQSRQATRSHGASPATRDPGNRGSTA
jgi:hypothetical protein